MSEKFIDDLIRNEYDRSLPLGFAERVAALAMERSQNLLWELLSQFTPRFGVALSAVALVLFLFGVVGEGPGLVESIANYSSLTEFFPLQ